MSLAFKGLFYAKHIPQLSGWEDFTSCLIWLSKLSLLQLLSAVCRETLPFDTLVLDKMSALFFLEKMVFVIVSFRQLWVDL